MGKDTKFLSRYGETPLHLAVRNSRFDIVEILLENGADMAIVGAEGTPLDVATRLKMPNMVSLLEKEGKQSLPSSRSLMEHQPITLAEKKRAKTLRRKKTKGKAGKDKKKKSGSKDSSESDAWDKETASQTTSNSNPSLNNCTRVMVTYAEDSNLSVTDKDRMVQLLDSLKLSKYISLFIDEDIGMRALMLLDEDDLKSLGVKMGARRVLLDYTQKERERSQQHQHLSSDHLPLSRSANFRRLSSNLSQKRTRRNRTAAQLKRGCSDEGPSTDTKFRSGSGEDGVVAEATEEELEESADKLDEEEEDDDEELRCALPARRPPSFPTLIAWIT